ncbi:SDR family NAD(P)-dependent oxidoreductase [Enterococcus sp. DIV1298c]|uniref:SDR family NAD(P)-dependent oxidoreductase n=1 Tax=Enterococcus sp. DIV1298c TaxID=2815328 RepID=UPI001A917C58|nr:SDR family NAD(P)-dependent oxidoreductase [Enterococcus sp. DIV1298c]MBO0462234.1 SDR family NAD(P)-dependent oxidoreductase [Enterococcus sp. DIV1298c]
MNIAVITGASSGLGKEFFKQVIKRYPNLDEVWLIARREEKLKELAGEYPNKNIRVIALDLSDLRSFDILDTVLQKQKPNIKVLINNAGFDRAGLFREMNTSDILSIINLNVTGMTIINRLCLPYMNKGSYEIISGSIGAFVPNPWRTVYSASKAYTRFLARSLREEERKRGINIMLLSPGNMDTEMNDRSKSKGKLSLFPYLDLEKETIKSMKKAEKGVAAYTPRLIYKIYRVFGKIVPSALAVKVASVESSVKDQ